MNLLPLALNGFIQSQSDPLWLKSVASQWIPAHIFEGYPRFVDLIETWCDFNEKRYDENNLENRGPYYPIKYFDKLVDLDDTRDDLLEWFKKTFAVTIPQFTAADTRLLIKNAVKFYVSRGTKDSIKFLLNTFFGDASANVYEPKIDLLRPSDATWYQPRLLALNDISDPLVPVSTLVLSSLYDQVLENPITFARGYVGNTQLYSGVPVVELLDKFGLFTPGDILNSSDGRQFIVNVLGLVKPVGRWLTTDSFMSSDKRMPDNVYWQDFSYEISSSQRLQDIAEAIATNTHPAGLLNFVKTQIIDYVDWAESLESSIVIELNINLIDVDTPNMTSNIRIDFLIEDYVQAFTDWSEFLVDASGGGYLSHDVTVDDLDGYTGSKLDIVDTRSHVLFNWGQRFAIPFLVPGQAYVSPTIDDVDGNSVRVNLEDFPMTEFEDVELRYLERCDVISVSNHSGFDLFRLAEDEGELKTFTVQGTAKRADRVMLPIISGKVRNVLNIIDLINDYGAIDTSALPLVIPDFGTDVKNLSASIFPNASVSLVNPTTPFKKLSTVIDNAIVVSSSGKVLFSGYDFHVTGDHIIFDPMWTGVELFVFVFQKNTIAYKQYESKFDSYYNTLKPMEGTFCDFSTYRMEII